MLLYSCSILVLCAVSVLLSDDHVFVIQAVIGTVPECIGQKLFHLVLVQTDIAHVCIVKFVINVVHTRFAVRLASCHNTNHLICFFCNPAAPAATIDYTTQSFPSGKEFPQSPYFSISPEARTSILFFDDKLTIASVFYVNEKLLFSSSAQKVLVVTNYLLN